MIGRLINADTTDVLTVSLTSLTDKNLYAYCDNNPVMRKDTGGAFWETALDIASVVVSITDVVANPTNATAWISLGADVACTLLPGLTGGGAIVRSVTKSDDVIDTAKAVYKAADKASDIRKATGSYEIVYKSDQTYVGMVLCQDLVQVKMRFSPF